MVRFWHGALSHTDLRQIKNTFRANGGKHREIRASVLRGDSLQNINKILKGSGVDINLSQTKSYISGSYAFSTFVNYIAKAQSKNNIRNGLGLSQLIRDGFRGITRVTVQGMDANGKIVFRNVDVMNSKYDSFKELLGDLERDLDEKLFDSLDITKAYDIVKIEQV